MKWARLANVTILFTIMLAVVCMSTFAKRAQKASADAGSLQALDENHKPSGRCPLKHTDVKAEISGFLSRVTVTQQFTNPFPNKIEAVYTFPLPQAAAVDDMTMLIGERTVKGKIMRRDEARAAYETAKQMGQVASLLDQERPNIFTQAVANIMPGEEIKITISYVETLQYEAGSYEWSFPMVVGERYSPSSVQPDDSSRISPPRAARPGHDISLEIQLNAGVPIQSLNSETHETEVERTGDNRAVVRLKDQATIPNKDFVLKYHVAGETIDDALLAHRAERGGFFTLILQPPQRVAPEDVMPKELVFVLDSSGSMGGFPFETAKKTLLLALDNLYPNDTFNVITFAGETRILFSEPVPATRGNITKAKKLLANIDSDGGTEMMKAITAALDPSDSQQHVRIVCFMTDGEVGNDNEILAEIQKHPNARVFAMGFSDSPNRYLLDKMAEYGRGEVDYVADNSDASVAAKRFHERVRNPLLTDVSVDWSNLPVSDVYPTRIPDLFSAKPVILSGRYTQGGKGVIRLKGRSAGQEFVREITIELPENEAGHDVLATLWARRRIDNLMSGYVAGADPAFLETQRKEITNLGLDFKLMTQFTSFVAIDDLIFTGGEAPQRVNVPVAGTGAGVGVGVGQSNLLMDGMAMSGSGVTATVEVTSSAGQSQMSCATNITSSAIQQLPLNGRSLERFMSFAPGIVSFDSPFRWQLNFSVNGQLPTSNLIELDGASANFGIAPGGESPGASAAGTVPALTASGGTNGIAPIATVQEVNISTVPNEPQYGRMPGAHVNVTTNAGSNAFHGSLFHVFGNDVFNANDWFANSRNLGQAPQRLNNFGGTFAGPIVKDKAFFFASYEGLRLRQPSTVITDVPSLSVRQAAPDSLRSFLNAFPVPNGPATGDGSAEFAATFANPARHDVASLRVDYNLANSTMLTFRYNFADSDAGVRGAEGFSLNTTSRVAVRAQSFTATVNQILSPTLILKLSANYSRSRATGSYFADNFGGALVPDNFLNLSNSSFGFDLNARGANVFAGTDAANVQQQFNLTGGIVMAHRNHEFRFGADYRRMAPILTTRATEQSLLFNGIDQALTGVPTRVNQLAHLSPQTHVFNNLSLYAQDDWKPTKRLKLTYGVRWELNPAPDSAVLNARLWETTYANFAPRFGFAYELSDKPGARLILRGGVGIHYDVGQEFAGDAFVDSVPFLSGTSSSTAGVLPVSGALPVINFDPHLKLPYTLNWNVSLQRDLGSKQTISAAYVASAGRRLLSTETFFGSDPQAAFLRFVSNRAESNYRALQVQFDRRLTDGLRSFIGYTWASSTDDATRDTARRVLFASTDADLDRGPSDFDVRHSLNGFVSYDLPAPFAFGLGNKLFRHWIAESAFTIRSAKPVNVLFGFPTTYGFAYVRPDVVPGLPQYLFDQTFAGGWRLNPAAFALPSTLEQGNLQRNSLRGFPFYQFDLALRRKFSFTERTNLQFQADAFNLFNHPNFADPLANDLQLGSSFGQSTALAGRGFDSFYNAGGARTLRFSLKLTF